MLGAMIGDMAGSIYEFANIRSREFPFLGPGTTFTDDTVMTVAVHRALRAYDRKYGGSTADSEAEHFLKETLIDEMKRLGRKFPGRGYGGHFGEWILTEDRAPYNSWGNGSAMRVSPAGFYAHTMEEARRLARWTAEVTHNHPEGIRGAEAVSASIFLARQGAEQEEIRRAVEKNFYDLSFTIEEIRPAYRFEVSCRKSVPQAIECFLESDSLEGAVRNCMYLGGDCDTTAAIAGGIAEAAFGVPEAMRERALALLKEGRIYEEIMDPEMIW